MKTIHPHSMIPIAALLVGLSCSPRAFAAGAELDCRLDYRIDGWSLVYKQATGSGTVTCENGESMPVSINAQAIGLAAGKWRIDDGQGRFTDVRGIDDVLGTYAQAEANAGLVKSGSAQVLTKGTVSLALAGSGEGVNLGVDVGRFEIEKR
jgi:hypothetical protein